jgi:hypothetical protein
MGTSPEEGLSSARSQEAGHENDSRNSDCGKAKKAGDADQSVLCPQIPCAVAAFLRGLGSRANADERSHQNGNGGAKNPGLSTGQPLAGLE